MKNLRLNWNLTGRDPFLAINWESDFSQACSFRRMSMNHKNFRFTPIPDKNNDLNFLTISKTLFLGHFWPFLVIFAWWRVFAKNPCHTQLYMGPKHHVKFQKKLMNQYRENLRSDGRTAGQTIPISQDHSAHGRGPNKLLWYTLWSFKQNYWATVFGSHKVCLKC